MATNAPKLKQISRALLGVFLLYFSFGIAFWQPALANSAAVDVPVVEMEPYIVKAYRVLPKPESWFYIKIPAMKHTRKESGKEKDTTVYGYEILFSGRVNDARAFARELQHRQVISGDLLLPLLADLLPDEEMIVIHNRRYSYLHKYGHEKRGLWDVPYRDEDASNANDLKRARSKRNYGDKRSVIIYGDRPIVIYENGQASPMSIYGYGQIAESGYFGTAGEAHMVWVNSMVYKIKEKVLWGISSQTCEWLDRGIGLFLLSMRIDYRGIITFDPRTKPEDTPYDFFQLKELLQPHARDRGLGVHPRYGINFIHYGLFGKKGANREKFQTLIERRRKEPFSEQMFREVWGKASSRIDLELEDYMRSGDVGAFVHKLKIPELPPVILREATQSEVARLKAELYVGGGETPNALDELRFAYWRGERDPAMLAMLASLEQRVGSEDRARKILKSLMAMPTPPPRVYIVAARLRLGELLVGKPKEEKLAAPESAELIALLSGALAGGIPDQELCAALAEVLLKSASLPDAKTTGFLAEAAKRYPSNKTIVAAYNLGAMSFNQGH